MGPRMSSNTNNNKNQAQTATISSVPVTSSIDNSKLLATSVDSSNTNQGIRHQCASNVFPPITHSANVQQSTTQNPQVQQQAIKATQQANIHTTANANTTGTSNAATVVAASTTATTGTSPKLVDYATEELKTDIGFAHSVSFFNNVNACSGTRIHFENAGYNNNVLGDHLTGTNKPIIAKINPNTTLKIYSKNNKRGQSFYYENPYMDRYIVVKLPNNFVIKSMDIRPYSASIAAEVTEGFSVSPNGIFISTNDILLILLIIALIWIWYYYCD